MLRARQAALGHAGSLLDSSQLAFSTSRRAAMIFCSQAVARELRKKRRGGWLPEARPAARRDHPARGRARVPIASVNGQVPTSKEPTVSSQQLRITVAG